MAPNGRRITKHFPTCFTFIAFLSCGISLGHNMVRFASDGLSTSITCIGFLSRLSRCLPIKGYVVMEGYVVIEGFLAFIALKGILPHRKPAPFPASRWFFPNFILLCGGLWGSWLSLLVCTRVLEKFLPDPQLFLLLQRQLAWAFRDETALRPARFLKFYGVASLYRIFRADSSDARASWDKCTATSSRVPASCDQAVVNLGAMASCSTFPSCRQVGSCTDTVTKKRAVSPF